jgi:light-regulated signal transduction histidine kinase (bacteriophytochrome)
LSSQRSIISEQTSRIKTQQSTIEEQGVVISTQQNKIYVLVAITLLILILIGTIYRSYKNKQKANKLLKEEITSRKRIEVALHQRTDQLEAANKEMEAFSYSVSHDLRAPLRGIDGFSQILMEEYQDKVDEKGKNYLLRIRLGTQRMAQLIDDMLNLSRLSRSEMIIQQVNLSEIVNKIAETFREEQPERNVEFIIQKGIKVQADRQLLQIVLDNLIGNAWKFTSKHTTARIEFGMQEQNDKPVCFVRDNGAGFDMNYDQNLFGAFQRLHTIDEFPGTGIGLATVQRIIHKHGGEVWAEGQIEKGATFYFTI